MSAPADSSGIGLPDAAIRSQCRLRAGYGNLAGMDYIPRPEAPERVTLELSLGVSRAAYPTKFQNNRKNDVPGGASSVPDALHAYLVKTIPPSIDDMSMVFVPAPMAIKPVEFKFTVTLSNVLLSRFTAPKSSMSTVPFLTIESWIFIKLAHFYTNM